MGITERMRRQIVLDLVQQGVITKTGLVMVSVTMACISSILIVKHLVAMVETVIANNRAIAWNRGITLARPNMAVVRPWTGLGLGAMSKVVLIVPMLPLGRAVTGFIAKAI